MMINNVGVGIDMEIIEILTSRQLRALPALPFEKLKRGDKNRKRCLFR